MGMVVFGGTTVCSNGTLPVVSKMFLLLFGGRGQLSQIVVQGRNLLNRHLASEFLQPGRSR